MKKTSFFKQAVSLFLCFCILFALVLSITAKEEKNPWNLPVVSGARAIYLYHYESDQILLKQSSTASIAPASTVKIMTGLLAIEYLEHRMDEAITLTDEMLRGVQGYTLKLQAGMTLKLRDLLYGVICGGGNDAATAIAVICCGSVDNFVSAMNDKAKDWGCLSTQYTNPTGIDDPYMNTTLDDTVILVKHAAASPLFLEISSVNNYSYTPQGTLEPTVFYNRNALISSFSARGYQNKHAQGLNAGMTERGGYCVATYAEDQSSSYLCIVMGAAETENGIMSYQIANTLLRHVLGNYAYMEIAKTGTEICSIPVELALPQNANAEAELACVLQEPLWGYLPINIDLKKDISYRPYLHQKALTAPVEANTVVGGVDIYWGEQYITTGKLIVNQDLPANGLLQTMDTMKNAMLSRPILLSMLAFLILFLLFYLKIRMQKR